MTAAESTSTANSKWHRHCVTEEYQHKKRFLKELIMIKALIPTSERLREAPSARFSGSQHAFDLRDLSAHLLAEAHPGAEGHRQITILRHETTTMVLFVFEAGGALANHRASGLVTIHVLDGALRVEAESETGWQTHELTAQSVLVLGSGLLHNVVAREASRMLLTVHLESAPTGTTNHGERG